MEELQGKTVREMTEEFTRYINDQTDRLVSIALSQCPMRRRWFNLTDSIAIKRMILISCGIQVRQSLVADLPLKPMKIAVYRRGKFVGCTKIDSVLRLTHRSIASTASEKTHRRRSGLSGKRDSAAT